ncbi:HAD family hydrolase [Kitasatospora sp. MAP5-34]|uniref:HAD family hydrolase n=1 Tax=Kitasatospora sp. MAP5-34 TaxID=3035102 RepID=UPI002475A239|nr:HAD family hydrolase [Kitasatospora sp. MAP5-34]MDH6580318.1 putative hydrolase of the HAD superfamily [Kitasatospora sp. MAP5-34]
MNASIDVSDVTIGDSNAEPTGLLELMPTAAAESSTWRPTAVVLDLFGTLVPAPDSRERAQAVREIATALRVSDPLADQALGGSWQARHDGTLRTTGEIAAHLAELCGAPAGYVPRMESALRRLAPQRLRPDASVLESLEALRRSGLRLGLLSDAAPDVAEAWDRSVLAAQFDVALFSCREGAVKPAQHLYAEVVERLGCAADSVLYCGDGGGSELVGALRCRMRAVRVERRGGTAALAFGDQAKDWPGVTLRSVEYLPTWLGIARLSRGYVR